ncbi:MAG: choice-of-anchor D domain-containing protein [Planctomycetota bacterium]|nr:choice-of-anchor D domain-containing protein [Planctomycetota bacterium]
MSKKILATKKGDPSRRLKLLGAALPIAAVALIFSYQISTKLAKDEVQELRPQASRAQQKRAQNGQTVVLDGSPTAKAADTAQAAVSNSPAEIDSSLVQAPSNAPEAVASTTGDASTKRPSIETVLEGIRKKPRSTFTKPVDALPELDKDGHWSFSGDQRAPYHASFDVQGLNFEVARHNGQVSPAHLRFQFEAAAQGYREQVFSSNYPEPRIDNDAIEFDHGAGLVEKYYKVDGGIEQFFVLNSPLNTEGGDLVLTAKVMTSATIKRDIAPTKSGIQFWDSKNNVMIRMSKLVILDQAGHKTHGQIAMRDNKIQYIVDGEWLSRATYPVTVDPIINGGIIMPATLPISEGFEAPLGPEWCLDSTVTGQIILTSAQGPRTGTQHLQMDSTIDVSFSNNEALLFIDLSNETVANLSFFHKETGDEDHPLPTQFTGSEDGDGVSISNDGTNWFRIVDLTGANSNSAYTQFTIDLFVAAQQAGFTPGADFQIKFQQFDNFRTTLDGFFFDDITIDNNTVVFDAAPDGDYGDVLVGNFRDFTFTLNNFGTTAATGTVAVDSNQFSVIGGASFNLAPNTNQAVTVRYAPTQLGRTTANITASINGFPSGMKLIRGNGTTPPIISWAATPNGDFGSVSVGSNSDRVFTLQNSGVVTASGMISVNNSNYQIVSGGGNYTVPAGGTRSVVVRFEPNQGGAIGATLTATLQNNANIDNPLSGVAQANPALLWERNPGGDFGAVATGNSKDVNFVLRNQGNTAASGTITVNNNLFTFVSGGGAYSLAAGTTRTVVVRFSPAAVGPQNATLSASIGAVPVANKGLTGGGIGANSVSFDAAPDGNFGGVVVGGNTTKNFVLRNSSNTAVSGSVSVTNTPIFSIIQGSNSFTLGPNSSQSVVVRFSPGTGAQTAVLTATVDNANTSNKSLSGEGVAGATAKFPFSEGFESGTLRPFWQANSTNEGRIRISSDNEPNLGNRHIIFDDAVQNTSPSLNELILTVDLAGQNSAFLTFHHKEFNDADHPIPITFQGSFNGDGVAISEDGQTWFGLINLTQQFSQANYQRITVDLAATAAQIGISLNGNFKIKFQQFDAGPVGNDGFAFDDIAIFPGAPTSQVNVFDLADSSQGARLIQRGTPNVVVMNLQIEANFFEDLRVDSISFSSSGTGHEVFDINRSRLYQDIDGDGFFDPNFDPQLGIDLFFTADNGSITYTNLNKVIPAGTSINVFLVWDISPNAATPVNFTPAVTNIQATGVISQATVIGAPVPLSSLVVNVEARVFVRATRPSGSGGGCQLSTGEPAGPESLILLLLALFGLSAMRRFR